jgi:hypothetical protein
MNISRNFVTSIALLLLLLGCVGHAGAQANINATYSIKSSTDFGQILPQSRSIFINERFKTYEEFKTLKQDNAKFKSEFSPIESRNFTLALIKTLEENGFSTSVKYDKDEPADLEIELFYIRSVTHLRDMVGDSFAFIYLFVYDLKEYVKANDSSLQPYLRYSAAYTISENNMPKPEEIARNIVLLLNAASQNGGAAW